MWGDSSTLSKLAVTTSLVGLAITFAFAKAPTLLLLMLLLGLLTAGAVEFCLIVLGAYQDNFMPA